MTLSAHPRYERRQDSQAVIIPIGSASDCIDNWDHESAVEIKTSIELGD